MTQGEFIKAKADSESRIRWRVIPIGIIYSVRLATAGGCILSALILCKYFFSAARLIILIELGVCAVLLKATFTAEKDSKAQFLRLGLTCQHCHGFLVFRGPQEGQEMLTNGLCPQCGQRVFDP